LYFYASTVLIDGPQGLFRDIAPVSACVRSGYRAPDRLLSTFMLYTATTILKEIDDDDDNDYDDKK